MPSVRMTASLEGDTEHRASTRHFQGYRRDCRRVPIPGVTCFSSEECCAFRGEHQLIGLHHYRITAFDREVPLSCGQRHLFMDSTSMVFLTMNFGRVKFSFLVGY